MKNFKINPVKKNAPVYPKKKTLIAGLVVSASVFTGCFGPGFGTIDGDVVECQPGDMFCPDENTIQICTENSYFETMACNDYCIQEFGPEYYAAGFCSEDNPCGCEYSITPGVIAECTPGEFYCSDAATLELCQTDENGLNNWTTNICDDYCLDVFGDNFYPEDDCDAQNTENPCGCVEMLAGINAECTLEDLICSEDGSLGILDLNTCEYFYETCTDVCGPEQNPGECDPENTDNPCNCH